MKNAKWAVGLAALLCLPPGVGLAAAWPDSPTPTEVIEGREWTTDIRITSDGGNDLKPRLSVGPDLSAHLLWTANRTAGHGFWHSSFTRFGEAMASPAYITNKSVVGWGYPYEYGPNVAVDSQGDIHVVWDDGAGHVIYAKYDEAGGSLIPEMVVDPSNLNASRNPTVAIGPDDSVVIAREEKYSGNFVIVVDKLDSAGGLVWSQRFATDDVAAYASIARLKVDRWNGEILVGFGSAMGSWVTRLDANGTKNMASAKVSPQSDYPLLDIATTADRQIHVVWVSYGSVHYTMINQSGAKQFDDLAIAPNGFARGVPTVATGAGNHVYVAWEDARFGESEIMLATWDSSSFSGGSFSVPTNVRLTNSGSDSNAPQLAADNSDNVYVAWHDLRDGNAEIYYKFSYACGVDVSADPHDYAALFFMVPGEAEARTFRIRNTGFLPENITVTALIEAATPAGWILEINRTLISGLPSGATAEINVSIRAPPLARDGDNASFNFTAVGACSPSSADALRWASYSRIPRQLVLTANRTIAEGLAGETVTFGLTLTNNASVRESEISISVAPGGPVAGWEAATGIDKASLDGFASTSFSAFVKIPEGARAHSSTNLKILACSRVDPSVCDAVVLRVVVPPVIRVELAAEPLAQLAPPGAEVRYEISIVLEANVGGDVKVELEVSGDAELRQLSVDEVRMTAGGTATVLLTARVPANATNGTEFSLLLRAQVPRYGASAELRMNVTTSIVHRLSLSAPVVGPVHRGETPQGSTTITNEGNVNESLDVILRTVPEGWSLGLGAGQVSNMSFDLGVGSNAFIQLWVYVSGAAPPGVYTLALVVRDAEGHEEVLEFDVKVVGDEPLPKPSVAPGDAAALWWGLLVVALVVAVVVRVWSRRKT